MQYPQFRSKAEKRVARVLEAHRIAYLYEHPLAVIDEGRTRIWYPDFQSYGLIVEYCGRMDDGGYAQGIARKQQVYRDNGLTALMLTPPVFQRDWPGNFLNEIEQVLTDRVTVFRQRLPQSASEAN